MKFEEFIVPRPRGVKKCFQRKDCAVLVSGRTLAQGIITQVDIEEMLRWDGINKVRPQLLQIWRMMILFGPEVFQINGTSGNKEGEDFYFLGLD